MVIPIQSNQMGMPLAGPIPPELYHRTRVIKMCVFGLALGVALKVLAGIVIGQVMTTLTRSLTLVVSIVIGIFVLNDDEHFKPAYQFMMNTCCQGCQDQCPGGMNCLFIWIVTNLLSCFLDILIYGTITIIIQGVPFLWPSQVDLQKGTFFLLRALSALCALLSQSVGSWYGWKAHQEAQAFGTEAIPGTWGRDDSPGGNNMGWNNNLNAGWGGNNGWGGGASLGATAPQQSSGGGAGTEFQVFAGQGQRLGGE